jgi:uncharacterized membrane protein
MQTKTTRRGTEGSRPEAPEAERGPVRRRGIRIQRSVTIDRPRAELYGFWREVGRLPGFMVNVKSVDMVDDKRSHWKVRGPAGRDAEWDAMIVQDLPEESIAWRSTGEADVENAGSVQFHDAPAGRGTVVTVSLIYEPPAGRAGSWVAMLFGREPSQQLSQDLRRFKALMETGEIPTSGDLREDEETAAAGRGTAV